MYSKHNTANLEDKDRTILLLVLRKNYFWVSRIIESKWRFRQLWWKPLRCKGQKAKDLLNTPLQVDNSRLRRWWRYRNQLVVLTNSRFEFRKKYWIQVLADSIVKARMQAFWTTSLFDSDLLKIRKKIDFHFDGGSPANRREKRI